MDKVDIAIANGLHKTKMGFKEDGAGGHRLSVIVPVYNTQAYLRECIDSILAQSVNGMEIILVDDGSTDGSPAICDEYAACHENITVFHIENSGQTAARYVGVQNAGGEYIGFVDSDDWVEPDMYAHMLDYAEENSLDMACCGEYFEKGGTPTERYNNASAGVYGYERIQKELLPWIAASDTSVFGAALLPHLWDKLFKRSIIAEALATLDRDIRWGEDICTNVKCVLKSRRLGVLRECLYHHRIHESSVCHRPDARALTSPPALYKVSA